MGRPKKITFHKLPTDDFVARLLRQRLHLDEGAGVSDEATGVVQDAVRGRQSRYNYVHSGRQVERQPFEAVRCVRRLQLVDRVEQDEDVLFAHARDVAQKPWQIVDEALHRAVADRLHERAVAVGQLTGDTEQNAEHVCALGRRTEEANDADAFVAEPRR